MATIFIWHIVELSKRPFFWALYPFAYLRRKQCRVDNWRVIDKILWLALDDSIHDENLKVYNTDVEYCFYGKRCALVEKFLPYDFFRSFYWGAWRNNSVNLMILTEKWIGNKTGVASRKEWSDGKSFYEVRLFSSGKKLSYLEYWFGEWRLQIGFLTCGRFQQQFRKFT